MAESICMVYGFNTEQGLHDLELKDGEAKSILPSLLDGQEYDPPLWKEDGPYFGAGGPVF